MSYRCELSFAGSDFQEEEVVVSCFEQLSHCFFLVICFGQQGFLLHTPFSNASLSSAGLSITSSLLAVGIKISF